MDPALPTKVSDLVRILVNCSSSDAEVAADKICKDPEAFALLATACGLSTAAVGYGGRLIVAGNVTVPSVTVAGIATAASGLVAARRFCGALVKQTGKRIDEPTRGLLNY